MSDMNDTNGNPVPPTSGDGSYGYGYGYNQNGYNQNGYGQTNYGQTSYGQTYSYQASPQTPGPDQQPKKEKKAKKEKKPKGERSSGSGRTFLFGFLGALVACVLCLGGFALWQNLSGSGSDDSDESTSVTLGSTESTIVDSEDEDASLAETVAAKCLPSVCSIDVYTETSSSDLYGYYYGYDEDGELTESSLGSGVVLSEDGYILTNYHVIEDSDALEVTIDGTVYEAEVVGYDSSSDIAVLKAQDASGLTAIEIGDSDDLTVGEWVMSIGSPFGLEQSVATGVVSATSRSQILDSTDDYGNSTGEYTIYPNMIQTDAAINPGNSGGALVNSDGQLIGINTLITSYSGNYSGVGFAIPANYAVSIAETIISGETPTHAQLGVSLTSIDSTMADRYGLSVDSGAYVTAVSSGSGAEEAGIQEGDIITAFDGEAVESASDLMIDVRTKSPGDTVTITLTRDGESMDVEVTLGSDEDDSSSSSSTQEQSEEESMLDRLFGGGSSSSGDDA